MIPSAVVRCDDAAVNPAMLASMTAADGRGLADDRLIPPECAVAFGFEDVAVEHADWPSVRSRLAAVGATSVTVAVGRADWLAFPWDAAAEWESSVVARTGRDFVRDAVSALDGFAITLVIDALAPRAITRDPDIAGRTADGRSSAEFLSVSGLDGGYFGAHLEGVCREVARRYRPARIGLTELMFDDATFGPEDLAHFTAHTGRPGFPVDVNGKIDIDHPAVHRWRSEALARLAGRIAAAVADFGVLVEMDVRANWGNPDGDRADSGHDYGLLLDSIDRIAVWNYFALGNGDPNYGAQIVASLRRRFGDRVVMSTGLWGRRGAVVSPGDLRTSLRAVASAGGRSVSVIPASLMSERHWEALEETWGGPRSITGAGR